MGQAADVIVIGGGMAGPAIAYGLARSGVDVVVLDEGDNALRAARGNFGLVWYQMKGLGMQRYADWTLRSVELWGDFAVELEDQTGIGVDYQQTGGLNICVGERALEARTRSIERMQQQAGNQPYNCGMLSRAELEEMFPNTALGEHVSGASFSPLDGHTNPLRLLRAMHAGIAKFGGRYLPGCRAVSITKAGGDFVVATENDRYTAAKVVLAAGHGVRELAPMVGLNIPIRPERGQILVTERAAPFLPIAMSGVRQTQEGSVMLGTSNEDVGFDDNTTAGVTTGIARKAIDRFPALQNLRVVRTWAAIRVLAPDKFPVYAESPTHPGAFATISHSAVTLAAANARLASGWICDGDAPEEFNAFTPERFRV